MLLFLTFVHYQHTSISKSVLPNPMTSRTSAFLLLRSDYNVLKFKGNRTEQRDSVQLLPSCAIVATNVPFNKT